MSIINTIKSQFSQPKYRLSIIVIIYKMPEQAKKTLYSLSKAYQESTDGLGDYEVIVVENSSTQTMDKDYVKQLSGNFRYIHREETHPTPVFAIDHGVKQAQGELVSIMIDGARMATPKMVKTIMEASLISKNAIIAVPGYHLGNEVQQKSVHKGYNEEEETKLLASIDWPKDGNRLFNIACLSGSTANGFLLPIAESNCLTVTKKLWRKVGGIDLKFTATGGGQANLDLYKRLCNAKGTKLILLPGEGTFHQYHGGVTTGAAGRDKTMSDHFKQYREIRGEPYTSPDTQPHIYGLIPKEALRFIEHSAQRAIKKSQ